MARPNDSGSTNTLPTNKGDGERTHGQTRQNIRSTKLKKIANDNAPSLEPQQEPNNQITNQAFATVEETGRVYTDQTGQFPITSSNGYRYMLVMYHYNTNAILVEPLKTRHGGYTKLYTHLTDHGFKPTTHWLDNEAMHLKHSTKRNTSTIN
jgi:hypothetical protein